MTPLELFVRNIDWAALRSQKQELVNMIWQNDDTPVWGLVHLVDALQDVAVEEGCVDEKEVYGEENEGAEHL